MGDRPTRSEAIEVANRGWNMPRTNTVPATVSDRVESMVEALSELWGGFAPEPIQVRQASAAIARDNWWMVTADGQDPLLTKEEAGAIAGRSNAWEEIKALVGQAMDDASMADDYNDRADRAAEGLQDVLNIMNRPEMGVGPKST